MTCKHYFKVSYNNGNQFSCGFVYNAYDKLMEDKTKFDSSIQQQKKTV